MPLVIVPVDVTVIMPLLVIGDPLTLIPVPGAIPTDVTVPNTDAPRLPSPFTYSVLFPIGVIVNVPFVVIEVGENEYAAAAEVSPIEVTVPPDEGLLLVMVYVGHEPVSEMPVPGVMVPVEVTVSVPVEVIGLPVILIPPAPVAATLVTVPPLDGLVLVTV